MRAAKITNQNNESVDVELKNGTKITLPPGCSLENVDVVDNKNTNLKVIRDLTEVPESTGKTRLLD